MVGEGSTAYLDETVTAAYDASSAQRVAHAGRGDEVRRSGRVCLELAAQLGGIDAQVVVLPDIRGPPHLTEDLLPGDETADVAGEQFEEPPLGRGQPDVGPGPGDPLAGRSPGRRR